MADPPASRPTPDRISEAEVFLRDDVAGWAAEEHLDVLLAALGARTEVLSWLVSLDDPEDVTGREQRRTVTLDQIISRARTALDPSADPTGDHDA